MPLRIAVAGLKHDHVRTVLDIARAEARVEVVGISDDDPQIRAVFERDFGLPVRFASHRELLESLEFEALVVCEAFGPRGAVVIDVLRAGKHVFADKPICTAETELREIAALAAERGLEVGVDLSLRHFLRGTGAPLREGAIGEIVRVTLIGPHGLFYSWRPKWYYQPGLHGGIINDLACHGTDYVRWITGRRAERVIAARTACVGLPAHPEFEMSGEMYYRLEGGAVVLGQVDYLCPEGHPAGWQVFVSGTEGDAHVHERDGLCLRRRGEPERRLKPGLPEGDSGHPFRDFLDLLLEGKAPLRTTAEGLEVSLVPLVAQRAADTGATNVVVGEV
jgi:predicted dehydrogenase